MVLKELFVWKSILDEFLNQEDDIIFGSKYWDDVMQGQRSNIDICLMNKVGQLYTRSMKLLKLYFDLKNPFSTSLSLDNVRNKSHIILAVNINSIISS